MGDMHGLAENLVRRLEGDSGVPEEVVHGLVLMDVPAFVCRAGGKADVLRGELVAAVREIMDGSDDVELVVAAVQRLVGGRLD